MNFVFICIDTLRYDHLSCNGNDWISTPNFEAFAREAVVFDNSYTGSFPTIPHRTDTITGRFGSPLHSWQPLAFDAVTFPRILGQAGWATVLIHDTPHLINVFERAPYMHDGRCYSLEEIWTEHNPGDTHGVTNEMMKDQLNVLIEYIKTY